MAMHALEFRAGSRALERIRKNGLSPDDVSVFAAAAGGPKGLMLAGVDPFLFDDWLLRRSKPLPVIGSSAGAWRVAMACRSNKAVRKGLTQDYIGQRYDAMPLPSEINANAAMMLGAAFGIGGPEEIFSHPLFRLQVITVRCIGLLANEGIWRQRAGGAAAFMGNAISRKRLARFVQRVIFHDPRMALQFADDGFSTLYAELSAENLQDALLASGSIPLMMEGVIDIAGAPAGTYRDGGVVDYQMDLPLPKQDGVVLLPHFGPGVTTGWLDKALKWRKPQNLKDTLVISPSAEFVKSLPGGKIPDRQDFKAFLGRNDERIERWNTAVARSAEMGDELAHVLNTDSLAERLQPLPE